MPPGGTFGVLGNWRQVGRQPHPPVPPLPPYDNSWQPLRPWLFLAARVSLISRLGDGVSMSVSSWMQVSPQNTAVGNHSQERHRSPPPILAVRIGHVPLNEPRTARPRSYASREAGIVLRTLCEAIVGPCGPSGSDQRSLAGLPGKRRLQ